MIVLTLSLNLCGASVARAATTATYYWDTTAGTGLVGGAGTWDEGTTNNWVAAISGTLTPGTWSYDTVNPSVIDSTSTATNNIASFQTGGTYTVTVSGTVSPTQINVAAKSSVGTNLTLTGGTLNLGSGTNPTIFSVDAASSLTVNSNIVVTGYGGLFQFDRAATPMTAANLTINGNISQSSSSAVTLRVSGGGTNTGLTLGGTNTFTGGVDIYNGFVTITNAAALGTGGIGFGYGSNTATQTLNANLSTAATFSQTLYMMANNSVAGASSTAQITSSGTAAVTFTGAMNFSTSLGVSGIYANHGNVSFVLGGTNTGNNTFQGAIVSDPGYTTTFTKTGTGTWVLTGNNSFTGTTTVSQGTLMISDATGMGLAGTSGITVASGGTLSFGFANQVNNAATLTLSGGTLNLNASGNQTMGALTLGQSSTIDFGAGSTSEKLTFANSSGQSWSGTLTLLDFTVGSDSLNFGSSTGLTAAQLAEISLSGYTASGLDSLGNVVFTAAAVPEPPTWASLLLGAAALSVFARARRRFESLPS